MKRTILICSIVVALIVLSSFSSVVGKVSSDEELVEFDRNTIYVDVDNVDGPWDGTIEHPFRYIEDGIDASIDGDTVYVFNGRYGEGYLVIEKSIKLIGEDGENTIIDSSHSHYEVIVLKADGITISGFTLKNAWTPFGRCTGLTIWRSNNNIISNNIIEENKGTGIYCVSTSRNLIINNIIRNHGGSGIYIQSSTMGPSSFNKIIRNHLENNNYRGINLYGFNTGRNGFGGNLFIQNNFINNGNPIASYKNSFHNLWFNNYWGRPHLMPMKIKGERTLWYYYDGERTINVSDILSAINGGASYEARFAVVGIESKEVC